MTAEEADSALSRWKTRYQIGAAFFGAVFDPNDDMALTMARLFKASKDMPSRL